MFDVSRPKFLISVVRTISITEIILFQCIDRRDEAGCSDCPSGKLMLAGADPYSSIFQYETVFELQHYKLRVSAKHNFQS